MEVKSTQSWDAFVEQVEALLTRRRVYANKSRFMVDDLLFRGQPNALFNLETTLERTVKNEIALSTYYDFVSIIKTKIESVTGKNWTLESSDKKNEWLNELSPSFDDYPWYDFLAYLRHHGMPSPMLDWSMSPYVAAFFAMNTPPVKDVSNVAVFVYLESTDGWKSGNLDEARIHALGPYVRTHRRHYLQQSRYTVCTVGQGRDFRYTPHERVVKRDNQEQDILWKLVIPVSERRVFLEHLQSMNITPFSLFDTEDKLMEDLCLSEIFLQERLGPMRNEYLTNKGN